jgi:hypothetical protein
MSHSAGMPRRAWCRVYSIKNVKSYADKVEPFDLARRRGYDAGRRRRDIAVRPASLFFPRSSPRLKWDSRAKEERSRRHHEVAAQKSVRS